MKRTPLPGAAGCPESLTDPEARKMWWSHAAHVHEWVGLTPDNAAKLAKYCATFLEWRKVNRYIDEHGHTRLTRRGPVNRPEVGRSFKLSRIMTTLASELACTPLGRARILERRRRQLSTPLES